MTSSFDASFEKVSELVHLFAEHEAEYLSPKYQESEVRTDFIDKFFIALGWDVHHRQQTNPREQEVKVEKNPDSNSSGRRADYAFHIKPDYRDPVFFVEAKKPSVSVGNPEAYFQIVRYGRSAKTPVGVLTDFQEFHIVDCRYEPSTTKSFPSAQIRALQYKDFLDREKFGYVYWLFSREAIEAGKLKEFAKELPKQRGKGAAKLTQEEARPTDDKFLDDLEEYRRKLAKAFKKSDETLDAEALTEATQKVIDRLVFVRFLEDRNIESDYIVDQIAARKGGAWKSFIGWSKELDVKYNGVVFKPHEVDKPSFRPPDEKVFQEICSEISHHNSKYLFSYIPVELLGSIYERFLGKVVTATAKRADIEYKPEVRKAGGVYYTPKYIVDYIVANTVGKILNPSVAQTLVCDPDEQAQTEVRATRDTGLTPKEVSKLRFADIACGSGSFLIAVYDAVLHHVESWYNTHPDEAEKAGCLRIDKGVYALSLKQKQQILLDNIYGVDIDPQAVEVAQLSLFLKFLESESGAGASQLSFERTKILPDLSKNIVCGNSLVEYDIADLFPLTDAEEKRIKPFSFQSAFKEVMQRGGFDAIVGNPPYVRQETLGNLKPYLELHYKTFQGTADLYTYFIERAMKLLMLEGQFGYIVANKWMRANYGWPLREWLKLQHINELVDFGDLPVFTGATTYPCILRMEKGSAVSSFSATNVETLEFETLQKYVAEHKFKVRTDALNSASWSLTDEAGYGILEKLKVRGISLGEYVSERIFYGLKTGLNEAFVIDRATRDRLVAEDPKSAQFIKPFLGGRDMKRYATPSSDKHLILFPSGWTRANSNAAKDAWSWLSRSYPAIARHLQQYTEQAKARQDQGEYWWELRACVYYDEFEKPKIMLPDISQRGNFMLDPIGGTYTVNTTYIIGNADRYLLGVLNSKCVTFFYSNLSPSYQGGYYRFIYQYLIQIPVPLIDQSDASQLKTKETIVSLVDQMLDTKKRIATAQRDSDRERLQLKCDYLDGEIDRLVYGLYGLTEEEIRIVEGKN